MGCPRRARYNGKMASLRENSLSSAAPAPTPSGAPSSVPAPILAPVMAIDYGRRRIGLALSDALGLTARPVATLTRTNRRDDLRRLREIIIQHGVKAIVVGHPLHLDGTSGEMAAEAARFAARLAKHLGLPVELMDERLSSWEAAQLAAGGNNPARQAAPSRRNAGGRGRRRADKPNRLRRQPSARQGGRVALDDVAAAVILRDFLDRQRARETAALTASRENA